LFFPGTGKTDKSKMTACTSAQNWQSGGSLTAAASWPSRVHFTSSHEGKQGENKAHLWPTCELQQEGTAPGLHVFSTSCWRTTAWDRPSERRGSGREGLRSPRTRVQDWGEDALRCPDTIRFSAITLFCCDFMVDGS